MRQRLPNQVSRPPWLRAARRTRPQKHQETEAQADRLTFLPEMLTIYLTKSDKRLIRQSQMAFGRFDQGPA